MSAITLPSSSVTTLLKLLGLCGSSFAGERATAAQMADSLVRSAGLTWADVVRAPEPQASIEAYPHDWREMRAFCAQHAYLLRPKERSFVANLVNWQGPLTERQETWLIAIYDRVRTAR